MKDSTKYCLTFIIAVLMSCLLVLGLYQPKTVAEILSGLMFLAFIALIGVVLHYI